MKKIYLSILSYFLLIQVVYAATFNVVGSVRYGDYEDLISANSIEVKVHKLGNDRIWLGALSKDGDRVNFNFPVDDLARNDQLIITGEVLDSGDDVDNDSYFGGVTTVITDNELNSGLVGDLILELNPIPRPEFDSMTEESIKMCWRGMNDFSVVGYDVYRTSDLFGDWESVGKSGQSSDKQVCFTDVNLPEADKYYYRIAVMTSWSAGEGREFFISRAMSAVSDGISLGQGVVDKRNKPTTPIETGGESDLTLLPEVDSAAKQNLKGFWNWAGEAWEVTAAKVEASHISWQTVIILVVLAILLLVLIIFFISISLSNTTSRGSLVWMEGDLDLDKDK
ncbi:MAG: hypothetical protein WC570_00910 [Patescibacteria group bacterium]